MTENTDGGRFVSPNDMLAAACDMMLDGRQPTTTEDRFMILNFVAVNTPSELSESICKLFVRIYDWNDISDQDCAGIAAFQATRKVSS